MNWELSAVPYWPIHRRLVWRKRLIAALVCLVVGLPIFGLQHRRATEPVSNQVFDDVATTIAYRYFDRGFHDVDWQRISSAYRPRVEAASSESERYALLRRMVAALNDSHTAVFSPLELQRSRATSTTVDWKVIASGVGYLKIAEFPDSVATVLGWAMSEVGRKPGLVLDLRGNPGGLVDSVDATAGIFLPAGTLVSSGQRRWKLLGTQRFTAEPSVGVHYNGKLVVLVDRSSRSGAESLARALQYYGRALIVGAPTAGKVLGVEVELPLPDGGLLRVATLDMRAPDGRRLEGVGVKPDVLVEGADAQLRTAIALARR